MTNQVQMVVQKVQKQEQYCQINNHMYKVHPTPLSVEHRLIYKSKTTAHLVYRYETNITTILFYSCCYLCKKQSILYVHCLMFSGFIYAIHGYPHQREEEQYCLYNIHIQDLNEMEQEALKQYQHIAGCHMAFWLGTVQYTEGYEVCKV